MSKNSAMTCLFEDSSETANLKKLMFIGGVVVKDHLIGAGNSMYIIHPSHKICILTFSLSRFGTRMSLATMT